MANLRETQLSESSSVTSYYPVKLFQGKGKLKYYNRLLDLYKQHECLWMESHKDFFNFELKKEIWDQIATQMVSHAYPNPNPERWKCIMHRLRYNVQLEQLHENKAKFCNRLYELPPKLCYSAQCTYILKHMFDRKTAKPSTTIIEAEDAVTDVPPESLAAKCMRLGRTKFKEKTAFRHKLKTLEKLRNRQHSTLSLTREAFHQLEQAGRKIKN